MVPTEVEFSLSRCGGVFFCEVHFSNTFFSLHPTFHLLHHVPISITKNINVTEPSNRPEKIGNAHERCFNDAGGVHCAPRTSKGNETRIGSFAAETGKARVR